MQCSGCKHNTYYQTQNTFSQNSMYFIFIFRRPYEERKEVTVMLSMTKVVFERFPVFRTDHLSVLYSLTNRSGKQSGLIIDDPMTSLCVSDFKKNPVMSLP